MKALSEQFQKTYIRILLFFVGKGLQSASRLDGPVRREIQHFPDFYTIRMMVSPHGPSLLLQKTANGRLRRSSGTKDGDGKELLIAIKNLPFAMRLFTFRESTALAFARNRMTVSGDLEKAIAFVRCLNVIESYLLPSFIARLAVKRLPKQSFTAKLTARIKIYAALFVPFV